MSPILLLVAAIVALIFVLSLIDFLQTGNTIRRNFPFIGRFRFIFEDLGPFMRQYFVNADTEGRPFDRIVRHWVYEAAEQGNTNIGFGTERDKDAIGALGLLPSAYPYVAAGEVGVGHGTDMEDGPSSCDIVLGPDRKHPYTVRSWVNISAMSYGSLSKAAIRSLSHGAAQAGCYLNTGEGGVSPHHLEGGCDLVFQIGTGKFGVRDEDGNFDPAKFERWCAHPNVKAIELKISQGAKPGKGGILPAAKVSEEIAAIRGVKPHRSVHSPPRHPEAPDAASLLRFVAYLQDLGGLPVGIKMAMGPDAEVEALVAKMVELGLHPDWITVDGAEGGTGAAPPSFADYMGVPLYEAIPVVEDALLRHGLRDKVRIIASGKLIMGAPAAIACALGADLINNARGFMLALGCIQALKCHTNGCPTGIATQNAYLQRGIVPEAKAERVAHYAHTFEKDLLSCTHAVGIARPDRLRRHHAAMVVAPGRKDPLDQLYPYPEGMAVAE
jgi:glutamate synthase domain-containing protein 2